MLLKYVIECRLFIRKAHVMSHSQWRKMLHLRQAAVGNHLIFSTILVFLTLDREEILLVWEIYLPPKIRRRNNNTGLLPFGFFTKFPFTQLLHSQNWSDASKNSEKYLFSASTWLSPAKSLLVRANRTSNLQRGGVVQLPSGIISSLAQYLSCSRSTEKKYSWYEKFIYLQR